MSAFLNLALQPTAVAWTDIPAGDWLPDLPELNNPGALEALNVIPKDGCYVPFYSHEPQANGGVLGIVRSAAAAFTDTRTIQLYAATTEGIYTRLSPTGAWTPIAAFATSGYNSAKFVRVNEQMVAIHPEYFPVRIAIGTAGAVSFVGGNPPRASCGAQVGDFLMLGNLRDDPDDAHGLFPSRVRWGGFNNIDLPWISSPITQADFQDMPADGGEVVAISGRDYGTIFQERMISTARFVGGKSVFDITTVEDKRGCIARDCVVDVGPYQFAIAEDGFYVWNGTNSEPIGNGKVDSYFFRRLNWSYRNRIVGAHDPVNGCVMWLYPTDSTGNRNELIIFSYRESRWSRSVQTLDFILTSAPDVYTMDDFSGTWESYTGSFDDPALSGGGRGRLAGFNSNHVYGLFTGEPLQAVLDTGEYSGPDDARVDVTNARPKVDIAAPVATVQALYRDQLIGEPLAYGDITAQEADGTCPVIANGRYLRLRTTIPAGAQWKRATGVSIARSSLEGF